MAPVSPSSGPGKWDLGLWGHASQTCPQRSGLCQAQAALLRPRALGWSVIGEEVGSEPQEQLSTAVWGLCGALAGEDSVGDCGSQRPGPEGLVPQSRATQARGPDGNPPAREAGPRASLGEPPSPTPAPSYPPTWRLGGPCPSLDQDPGKARGCSAQLECWAGGPVPPAATGMLQRASAAVPCLRGTPGPSAPPSSGLLTFSVLPPLGSAGSLWTPQGSVLILCPLPCVQYVSYNTQAGRGHPLHPLTTEPPPGWNHGSVLSCSPGDSPESRCGQDTALVTPGTGLSWASSPSPDRALAPAAKLLSPRAFPCVCVCVHTSPLRTPAGLG